MAVDTCPLAGITWLVPLPLQGTAANRRLFSAGLDFPTPGDRRNCSSHRVQDCDVPDITVGGGRNAKASTSHAKGKGMLSENAGDRTSLTSIFATGGIAGAAVGGN